MDITLGLDFGTHQSKLCMSYMPNNETIYEFVEFPLSDGTKSVLIPSLIQINKDDTIRIGSVDRATCAMRPVPPPEKPVFPPRPETVFPEEPDRTLPPKPVREAPRVRLEALTGGAEKRNGQQKPSKHAIQKEKARFRKKMQSWAYECQLIEAKYYAWERECLRIAQRLKAWQKEVASIQAKYVEEYAEWEKHQMVYRELRYFKQAAFTSSITWDKEEIPADILSIWYLTYLLLYVRRYVKEKFDEVFEESVSVQMGVPSGLNDGISRGIRFRGQRFLVAARHLMESFDSPEKLCTIPYTALMEMTKQFDGNVVEEAEQYGFVVIPEAYAGLQSLTYSRRLSRGNMHLLVDVGGGTTDIAFFTIDEARMPSIHTVSSFTKGLNYVLERFIEEHPMYSMAEAQARLRTHTKEFHNAIDAYTRELRKELNYIVDHVTHEFNVEIAGTGFSQARLTEAMVGRPIVYCGGGSVFPNIRIGHHYFSDQRLVNKDVLNIPNLQNRGIDSVMYTILATSYGLSIPTFEEIKTKDARHLWKMIADNIRSAKPVLNEHKDYYLSDD